MTIRPTKRSLAALALGLATTLVVGGLGSTARGDDKAAVGVGDLPRVAQVARIYPDIAGGSRATIEIDEFNIVRADCRNYRPYALVDGIGGMFAPASGLPDEQPVVGVWEFGRRSGADDAIRALRQRIRHCAELRDDDPETPWRRLVAVPGIGDVAPVAWREVRTGANDPGGSHLIYMYTRVGRKVVAIEIFSPDRPSLDRAIRFARLSARSVD